MRIWGVSHFYGLAPTSLGSGPTPSREFPITAVHKRSHFVTFYGLEVRDSSYI